MGAGGGGSRFSGGCSPVVRGFLLTCGAFLVRFSFFFLKILFFV